MTITDYDYILSIISKTRKQRLLANHAIHLGTLALYTTIKFCLSQTFPPFFDVLTDFEAEFDPVTSKHVLSRKPFQSEEAQL